jgi:hypothetical protein
MQIRRVVAPCLAVLLLAASASVLSAQRNNDNNRQQQQQQRAQRSPAEQMDVDALVRTVDAVAAGTQPAPTDVGIAWDANHFLKGQADTYIPVNLTIDRAKMAAPGAALYVRVVDKNAPATPAPAAPAQEQGRNNNNNNRDRNRNQNQQQPPAAGPRFAWETISFIDLPADGKIQRAVALKPGEYEAFIAVKERTTDPKATTPGKIGVLRQSLTVPDFATSELKTSSVLLAKAVESLTAPLSPAQQEANPYVFGQMRIVPAVDGKFAKSGEFQLFFWIYGAQPAANGKPDVTVEYNFHQRLAEGEKYFNKTQPQELNAQSLPPEFSLAAGHQLYTNLAIPLTSFPVGDYRLEIKITDKPSGKSMTQNVNFTVLPL